MDSENGQHQENRAYSLTGGHSEQMNEGSTRESDMPRFWNKNSLAKHGMTCAGVGVQLGGWVVICGVGFAFVLFILGAILR